MQTYVASKIRVPTGGSAGHKAKGNTAPRHLPRRVRTDPSYSPR